MADAYEYEFTEDEVETEKEWWLELEEGSLSLQMTGSKFDSCLLINIERDPIVGFVAAKVATEEGTKAVRLSLKHFNSSKNKFCEMFKEKTFSRTMFLQAFKKYKSATEGKKQANELSACSEVSPTENVKDASTSSSCKIAPDKSGHELSACSEVSPTENVKDASTSSSCKTAPETSPSLDGVPEEDDNCSPATLEKHKVADSIKLRISLLRPPSNDCQVRDVDENHSKRLQEEMLRNPDSRYLKMLIHIPDLAPTQVDIEKINTGKYRLEVLGGNHTRLALQTMQGLAPTECLDAVVYSGLSRNQALCLGILHNEGHQMAKAMTFRDYVNLFRRIWSSITVKVDKPTNSERKKLKDTLSNMFRLPRKQIGTKFRHHVYLATLDNDAWQKVASFMAKWEERKISGQPLKPLSQFNTAVLEKVGSKEDLVCVLTQLLEGKVTWPDIRHQVENKRQEPKVKTAEKPCCHKEVHSLRTEVETLKRKNSELVLEVAALKQKMMKMQDPGSTTSSQGSEKKKITSEKAQTVLLQKITSEKAQTDELREGHWIGVLFNSKWFLGRVLEVGSGWVRTQFLTGRAKGKLNKRDIQQVRSKFIIGKAKTVEEKDGVFFMSKDEEHTMDEKFQLYKEKYL